MMLNTPFLSRFPLPNPGAALAALLLLPAAGLAETYPVTNVNTSGAGSLRQAILEANDNPGLDTITFQISGTGVQTITLDSVLPPILDAVSIDGTTQPGYAGTPLIQVNGAGVVNSAGLRFLAGSSTVRGLSIIRFLGQAIEIGAGAGGSLVAGNYIGVAADGVTARPNELQGIWINNSIGNVIGGTAASDRNLISGNLRSGVYILGGSDNTVQGNFIGTTASGGSALPNGANGISINGSARNLIGGPTAAARNVISGNSASGIYLQESGSSSNLVQGNLVGLAVNGTLALGNTADGITVNNASGNRIRENVLSGNKQSGVYVVGTARNNFIQGNLIGTDASGITAAGNTYAGVTISRATNNLVGGTAASAANVIAGNKSDGVFLTTNSAANTLAGNRVGLNAAGAALPNLYNGITVDSAFANDIGPANVIAGNTFEGVSLGNGSASNSVHGNLIGTDPGGTSPRANGRIGVLISRSPRNTIGLPGQGNVISGNGDAGLSVFGSTASGNVVQGNRIGTDATGMVGLGNYREGIYLLHASSNLFGGTSAAAANLVSANGTWGISLTNTSYNVFEGNIIGAAADRVSPLANATRVTAQNSRFHSVEIAPRCYGNRIGGTEVGAGNLVAYTPSQAGVLYAAVRVRDGSTNNAVLGNRFVGNAGLGIDLGGYLVTPNDACDVDGGANQLQNFPILTQAIAGNGIHVSGTLNTSPNTLYRIEFFANPPGAAPGQAEKVLGSKLVSTGPSCTVNFTAILAGSLPEDWTISAMATDPSNNTSELSAAIPALPVPTIFYSHPEPESLRLAWPADAVAGSNFVLKQTLSLVPPIIWSAVPESVVNQDGLSVATIPVSGPARFFVLTLE